ncbi:MAG: hypothetical protein A3J49_14075 [Gallionellales bacterium RIFCSPHIGHO2_02_FULL_57_16]|nr:MAG: hypothetical protein A3J49_14075 [Gallionellales bacterium RIFCSPHIGHO2_02_FULL_57_16]
MHWVFAILAAIAIAFTLLGALSVWATVLLMSLKIVFALFVGLVLYNVAQFAWQRFSGRNS